MSSCTAVAIWERKTERRRRPLRLAAPIHPCWECGEAVTDSQLVISRGELQADVCEKCEPWARAMLSKSQKEVRP